MLPSSGKSKEDLPRRLFKLPFDTKSKGDDSPSNISKREDDPHPESPDRQFIDKKEVEKQSLVEVGRDGASQINILTKKLNDFETKYTLTLAEKERLERILFETNSDLEVTRNATALIKKNWQRGEVDFEGIYNDIKARELKIVLLSVENERLYKIIDHHLEENTSLQQKLDTKKDKSKKKKGKILDELKDKDEKMKLFMKENERLSKDIRELKSYADKKFDGKTKDIPLSSLRDYEVLRKELREKKDKIAELTVENEILQKQIQVRDSKKIVEPQPSVVKQIEVVKSSGQQEQKLSEEIERLRKIIFKKDEDAQTLAYVIRDKEGECKELFDKNQMLERALLELKNNLERKFSEDHREIVVQVRREKDELELEIKRLKQDNVDYKYRVEKLDFQSNQTQKTIQNIEESYQGKIKSLQSQIEDWRERHTQLEIEVERSRYKDMHINELEEKIKRMNTEIERQDGFIGDKIEEINMWREKYNGLESEGKKFDKMQETLRNYEMQVGSLIDEVDNWKTKYMRVENLMSDKESVEARIQELTIRNQSYEKKLPELSIEIQRLTQLLRMKAEEAESFRKKALKIDEIQILYHKEREQLQDEIIRLRQTMDIHNIESLDKREGRDMLPGTRKDFETKITLLEEEIERLNKVLKERLVENEDMKNTISKMEIELKARKELEKEVRDYERRLKDCLNELDKLNLALKDKSSESDNFRLRLGQLESRLRESMNKNSEYELKILEMSEVIQRLNEVLKNKSQEYDSLRIRLGQIENVHEKLAEYDEDRTDMEAEIKKLRGVIEAIHREMESWKERYQNSDREKSRMVTENGRLLNENGRLLGVKSMNNDYERRFQILNEDNARLEKELFNWKDKCLKLEREVAFGVKKPLDESSRKGINQSQVNREVERLEEEIEFWRKKCEKMERENSIEHLKIQQELALTAAELIEQEKRPKMSLEQHRRFLEDKVNELNQDLGAIEDEKYLLRQKIDVLSKECDVLYQDKLDFEDEQKKWTHERMLFQEEKKRLIDDKYNMSEEMKLLQLDFDRVKEEKHNIQDALDAAHFEISTGLKEKRDLENQIMMLSKDIEQTMKNEGMERSNLERRVESLINQINMERQERQPSAKGKLIEYSFEELELLKYQRKEAERQSESLADELRRLKNLLRVKSEENESLIEKVTNIPRLEGLLRESDAQLEYLKSELKQVTSFLKGKSEENEYLQAKIEEIARLESKNREQDFHITELRKQTDHLNSLLQGKIDENEYLMKRFQDEVPRLEGRKAESDDKVSYLTAELERISAVLRNKADNQDYLRKQIEGIGLLETRYRESEQKSNKLASEIERLSAVLNIKTEENEYLKKQLDDIPWLENKKMETEKKAQMLATEKGRAENFITRQNEEIEILRRKVEEIPYLDGKSRELESKVSLLNTEIDRLNIIARDRDDELEFLRRKLQGVDWKDREALERDIRRLKEILEIKLKETDDWKEKYVRLENLYSSKGPLEAEIQKLSNILELKLNEIDDWKARYAKLDIVSRDKAMVEEDLKKVTNILEAKLREIDAWKDKYERLEGALSEKGGLEVRVKEYDQKIDILSSEIERLNRYCKNILDENENLKRRNRQVEVAMNDSQNLKGELLRIKGILEDKMIECDDLKSRCSEHELQIGEKLNLQGMNRENEARINIIRDDFERCARALKEKTNEVEDLRIRCSKYETLVNDRELLEGDIYKLKDLLEAKLQEIDDWKSRCSQLEIGLAENGNFGDRMNEYEHKIGLLTNEIERISGILRQRNSEIEEWRVKYARLESGVRDRETLEDEVIRMKEILEMKLREVDEWKSKCSELELILAESGNLRGRIKEYENKIGILTKEIEKMSAVLRERNSDIEEWRVRSAKMEGNMRQNQSLENEIRRLRDMLEAKLTEVDDWKSKYARLEYSLNEKGSSEAKYRDYEQKISLLSREIERLGGVLKHAVTENDEWRVKCSRLEQALGDRDILEGELKRMKEIIEGKLRENDDMRARYSRLELAYNERRGLEGKVDEYENKIAALAREIERLSDELREKTREAEELKIICAKLDGGEKDRAYMESEIIRLKDLLEMKLRDIDDMRLRLSDAQQVHPRIRNYEERLALLQEEINQLSNALRDKSGELENWKVKHQGALQERDFISNELERVKYILEEKIRENETLRRRFEDLEHENQRHIEEVREMYEQRKKDHLEVEKRAHSGVIEDLHLRLSILKDEVATWKEKYTLLEGEFRQRETLEFKNKDLEKKNSIMIDELEKISLILKEKVIENEELRSTNIEIKQNSKTQEYLEKELKRLREIVDERSEELEHWRIKCSRMEVELSEKETLGRKVVELDEKSELLICEIERLNKLIKDKNGEIDDWRMKNSRIELATKEFATIKEDNTRLRHLLELKIAELDEMYQKFSFLESSAQERVNLEFRKKESENRVGLLISEVERLRETDQEKDEKINELGLFIRKMEIELTAKAQMERELQKLKGLLERKVEEVDDWKLRYAKLELVIDMDKENLENRLRELDRRNLELHSENNVLKDFVVNQDGEVKESNQRISNLNLNLRDKNLLEQEIAKLKQYLNQKLTECEDKDIKISKLQILLSDKESLEDQIKEYEEKVSFFIEEIERLHDDLKDKEDEAEKLRLKIARFNVDNRDLHDVIEENAGLRKILEDRLRESEARKNNRSSVEDMSVIYHEDFEKKSSALIDQHQKKVLELERALEEAEKALKSRILLEEQYKKEIRDLQKKLEDSELEINNHNSKIEIHKKKLSDVEKKLAEQPLKSDKVNELTQTILLMGIEIERLNQALQLSEAGKNESEVAEKMKYLEALDDTELWKAKSSRLELELASKGSELDFKVKDFTGRIGILQSEVTRLNLLLQEKNSEQDELKRRNSILDKTMREKEVFELEIARLKEALRNKEKELEEMRPKRLDSEFKTVEVLTMENAIRERDSKVEMLKKEINRLGEVENKRGKERESETKYLKELLEEKSKELQRLQSQIEDLPQRDSKIRDYENKITLFMNEIERLNKILKEKTVESDSLFRSVEIAQEEKNIIEKQLKQAQEEVNRLERELSDQKLKLLGYNRDFGGQDKLNLLKTELERLNRLLVDKTRENEDLKGDLQQRIFKWEREKVDFEREIERLKSILKEKQSKLDSLSISSNEGLSKSEKSLLLNEIENLKALSNTLSMKLTNVHTELDRARGELDKAKYSSLKSEKPINYENEIRDLTQSRDFYKSRADLGNEEFLRTNKLLVEKIQELEVTKFKYDDLMSKYQELLRKVLCECGAKV